MLSFLLNNNPFVLSQDTTVRLEWNNPALHTDKLPGDIGIDISIPVNDNNRMLLGNPGRFEKATSKNSREFSGFEIRYGGVLLMIGTLIIQNANEDSYSGWLRSSIGNLAEIHREKFIYDSISFNEEKIFINKSNYDPDSDEYGCPQVLNTYFFKDKGQTTQASRYLPNPNYNKWIWEFPIFKKDEREYRWQLVKTEDYTEAFMQRSGCIVNKKNIDGTIRTPDTNSKADPENIRDNLDVAVVSPMLFLSYVLKTIFKDAGFYVDENFILDNDDLKRLIIYHNYDITEIRHTEDFNVSYSDKYSMQVDDILIDYQTEPVSVGFLIDSVYRKVNKFYYKKLLPQIKLGDFLLSTMNNINVFPFFRRERNIVDIIDRESILTQKAINIDEYMIGQWNMAAETDSTLKFLNQIDSDDFVFSEIWLDISEYRDKEKEPVDLWTALANIENPEIDEIRFVKESNGYAQYKLWLNEWDSEETGDQVQEKFIGWDLLTKGFQNAYFNYGKETELEIKTEFSSLFGEQLPYTKQRGNMQSEQFEFETFSPRLLFYNANNDASYKTENLSLDFEDSEIGLLKKRWNLWARFLSTKQEVSRNADFPLNALIYVVNNIYKKYRSQEGEFIIDSISTEFGINRISISEMKAYKINYSPKTYSLTDMWQLNDIIKVDDMIDFDGLERYYPMVVNF
ncbi:hypothetical protein GM418_10955 [Maribellus comscasis]|uniref:Uncharacterized protein n=1 Tax=Maribellus comscasis TaxID=2681766 RepID=A0A6I6JSU7_9BACT|nr:hypothetical protein [Maribellus comscasis]QGY44158.1 hypothetical protein GM418_10955 [Maribellus comscasis]